MSELRRIELRTSCESVSLWWRSLPSWVFPVRMHCLRRSEELVSLLCVVVCDSVKFSVEIALWSCWSLKRLK